MKQYKPAIRRGIGTVARKLKQMRIEGNGTLDGDGLAQQWQGYQALPLADRAVWVSQRLRTDDKAAIEDEMISYEKAMQNRFGG